MGISVMLVQLFDRLLAVRGFGGDFYGNPYEANCVINPEANLCHGQKI
jgi:hypothetical protein